MQKLNERTYFLCATVLTSIILISLIGAQNRNDGPSATYGIPVIYVEELSVDTIRIDSVAEQEGLLYLLDSQRGYIRVFDLQGQYLRTMLFYDYLNGEFQIATNAGELYVRDPHGDIYVISGGEFDRFVKRSEIDEIIQTVDFEGGSDDFYIRFGSVWQYAEPEDICVIKRPFISILFQSKVSWLLTFSVLAGVAVIQTINRKKKSNKQLS